MSRNNYSAGKRAREAERARKKRDKAERKRRNRENATGGVPIATVDEIQPAAVQTSNDEALEARDRDVGSRGPPAPRIFVGHLSWDTTSAGLKEAFETHGEVLEATVMTDRDTGRSRGFGFVTMANRRAAMQAIEKMDGQDLDGRTIRVSVATERS